MNTYLSLNDGAMRKYWSSKSNSLVSDKYIKSEIWKCHWIKEAECILSCIIAILSEEAVQALRS